MKTIKRYNLPIDTKYTILGFDYVGSENATTCQNCDRAITNTATVQDEQDNKFIVGLDCAETLSYCSYRDELRIKEQVAKHNKYMRYVRQVKKAIDEGIKVTKEIGEYRVFIYYNNTLHINMIKEVYNTYFTKII